MNRITLFDAEWNCYNGFSLTILGIDYRALDSSLFGLSFSKDFIQVSIFFYLMEFEFKREIKQ